MFFNPKGMVDLLIFLKFDEIRLNLPRESSKKNSENRDFELEFVHNSPNNHPIGL